MTSRRRPQLTLPYRWSTLHHLLWPGRADRTRFSQRRVNEYHEVIALLDERDFVLEDYVNGIGARPYATRVVAASNSIATDHDYADFVCDGTDDDEEIQEAINELAGFGGGVVLLLEGSFYVAATITVPSDVTLRGLGPGTILIPGGVSNSDYAVEGSGTARRVAATASGGA